MVVTALVLAPTKLHPQHSSPIIDTIVIVAEDVYSEQEASRNLVFRLANAVRFTTRPSVVRREVLLRAGRPYDSALAAESERNLRSLGKFRDVSIDTMRINDRFAVVVNTADSWSTDLNPGLALIGGRSTYSIGLTEKNLIGLGYLAGYTYKSDFDRDIHFVSASFPRLIGSNTLAEAEFEKRSDGKRAWWRVGWPFRTLSDRGGGELLGEVADHRVLQYRVRDVGDVDTLNYQRRVFSQQLVAAAALKASPAGYWRVGTTARVAREEIFLEQTAAAEVQDSVKAAVGVFTEIHRANFKVVNYYNGFGRAEDLDLSTTLRLSLWVAPALFGHATNGIAPTVSFGTGASLPFGFMRAVVYAGGLFNSGGLDSGRVHVHATVGAQLSSRHATFLHLNAGALESPAPGSEFDFGYNHAPLHPVSEFDHVYDLVPVRYEPHSFVGTRQFWGTLEHRWFTWENLLANLGLGFAAFLDYGGAWYPDLPIRAGGSVGLGLRFGFSRATGLNVGRFDCGYQFGGGWEEKHWVCSGGSGFVF